MTTPETPAVCYRCVHFIEAWRCTAFPERIPDEVIWEGNDHTKPIAGDHGIRFEPIDDAKPRETQG